MILFTVTSILGTVFLWYTYFEIKMNLNKSDQHLVLTDSLRNEKAFFWYSIIATVITVSCPGQNNLNCFSVLGCYIVNCDSNEKTSKLFG